MFLPLPSSTAYERRLVERAVRWPDHLSWADLTDETLRALAEREGIDFATTLLYCRVVRSPEHGPLLERLASFPPTVDGGRPLGVTLVVAPGALYREYPRSGADGRLLREVAAGFGCRTEVIPVASFGSLAENARTIRDWLAGRPEEPVILASVSKGGADVKAALALPDGPSAFRNVVAWINLCGLLPGSPLVNWMHASRLRTWWYRPFFRFYGVKYPALCELARGPAGALDFDLALPAHVRLINVVGFPLSCHPKNHLGRRCCARLRPLGPNDGGLLLADVCRLPGLLCPVWGADHYMRPTGCDVREVAARILHYLSDARDEIVPQEGARR